MKGNSSNVRFRVMVVVGLLSLLGAGCSQSDSDPTTTSTREPTTIAPPGAATSTAAVSTTTPTSTTTTLDGVTVHPNLPSALSRGLIPWDEVGAGWYVVLYDSSKASPETEADVREGPMVLYLVNGAAERYEVAAWEPGKYLSLVDATGTSALVANFEVAGETVYEVLDMTSGLSSVAYTLRQPEELLDIWPRASLTRPNGANVVVHRSDGVTEWLERRTPSGSVLAVAFEQDYVDGGRSLPWLYGPDGTSLIVAGRNGISERSNHGSSLGKIWSPPNTWCEPVRWWDADTFLAVCYGQGPGSAPLDDNGELHTSYGRLWLLDTDGSRGAPLTEFPEQPPMVVDFGYHDSWPTDDETFIQWSGDCGSSAVATLNPQGTGDVLDIEEPGPRLAHGVEMVDVHDGVMAVYGWSDCAATVGGLFTVDLEGRLVDTLVPVVGDARGVTGVTGLATVYPAG